MKKNLAYEARKAYTECLDIHPNHKEAQLALRTVLSAGFDISSISNAPEVNSASSSANHRNKHNLKQSQEERLAGEALSLVVYENSDNVKPLMKLTQKSDFKIVLEGFDAVTPTSMLDNMCDE